MATTITLALVVNDRAFIANVGDSRTYLLVDGRLQPLTVDHSMVAQLVAAGMAAPEDIYTHPQRNVIYRSLGVQSDLTIDLFPADGGALPLQPGMRLLLCSDGLWEMVRDFDLEEHFLLESDPQKLAARLIAAANEGGGADNVSAIVVNVEG